MKSENYKGERGQTGMYSEHFEARKHERELKIALNSIEKRANRKEQQLSSSFATSDISPFSQSSFYVRHAKDLSYVGIECFHATMFHFIDTVKVRGMARNLTADVSFYFKN